MGFEFATAGRILFGAGTRKEVPSLASAFGRRALLVTGSKPERAGELLNSLVERVTVITFCVSGEPTVDTVQDGIRLAREGKCDMVIGIGGGSVLDTGKAIAAMLTNEGVIMDYLEVIGRGKPLTKQSAPYIAIPTTAGTGAEVTRNAVMSSPAHSVKVSLRSHLMLPSLAVVDPALTYSLPPSVTASTGLDALAQLIEPYVCNSPNRITDTICREGMRMAAGALPGAYKDGNDADAREDMSLASLFGGMALANARLGAVHGFAGSLGCMLAAPHGNICARLLPVVMKFNVKALQEREPASPVLSRYSEVAQLLTGRAEATIADCVSWIYDLCSALSVPSLSAFGLTERNIPEAVAQAKKASSMKGNPVVLTDEELTGILKEAL